EKYAELDKLAKGFFCLLVRYGTDQYIANLASDQEKHEGRLRNKVIPMNISFDDSGNACLHLDLPVHKRLGSQFKCFVDARSEQGLDSVRDILKSCGDSIKVESLSGPSKKVKSRRIYFLLDRFYETRTIDQLENNMIFLE